MNEYILKFIVAFFGTVTTYMFGGWSPLLEVLAWLVIIDYATGVYAAFVEKKLSSNEGFKGLGKKVLIFFLVAAAHKMDIALGTPGFLGTITIYFYIANEGLSLLENGTRAGLPVPGALRSALIQLKKRSDQHNDNKGRE
ncbi:phage holin family protein [Brevibacillus dissolubilis]|uniref:phage holin family protein n=1 Tax=Brevibacillus dissolubilis TaxID=1844116 RepID=UPI00210001F5|nr:phage holin family protein [Brevibacillus dissolubilis]